MAERVREYSGLLLDRAARGGASVRVGGQPWVLPIVVYNGSEPWMAAGQISDLMPLPSPAMWRDLALLQPQAYRLLAAGGALTSGARRAEDWPLDNRVSATVRLQRAETPRILARLRDEAERFPGAANRAFREALHAWAKALWADKTGCAPGFPALDEIERTGEEVMPTIAEANWDQWEAGVRAEGVLQGRASLISRQAALRFGVRTAERLSVLLNNLAEREELEQVGDWIIECGSGDELLARVSGLL